MKKTYSKIILDSCDYKTNLKEKYSCTMLDETSKKIFNKEIILKKRNENLVIKIRQNKNDKLLIIYGENHFEEVKKILENN